MPDKPRQSSPPSEAMKEQQIAGARGGPQQEREEPDTERQPPQTSNRRSKAHEHAPKEREFSASNNPNDQGEGSPGPEQLKRQSSMQGHGGRSHSGAPKTPEKDESSQRGEPKEEHTRGGRQKMPGDRDPVQ
jgi:hypothetical protein